MAVNAAKETDEYVFPAEYGCTQCGAPKNSLKWPIDKNGKEIVNKGTLFTCWECGFVFQFHVLYSITQAAKERREITQAAKERREMEENISAENLNRLIEDETIRCETCRFFCSELNGNKGDCHYNPPVVLYSSKAHLGYIQMFPHVESWSWCGKHEKRTEETK